jgi:hypothetical protein
MSFNKQQKSDNFLTIPTNINITERIPFQLVKSALRLLTYQNLKFSTYVIPVFQNSLASFITNHRKHICI